MKPNPALLSMKSVFQVMKSNLAFHSNPALNVLRDQIKKGTLELCSSEPTQPYLSSENYVEILYLCMEKDIRDTEEGYEIITSI